MNTPVGATHDGRTCAGFPIVPDMTLKPDEMAVVHGGKRTVFRINVENETATPVRDEAIEAGGSAPPVYGYGSRLNGFDELLALRIFRASVAKVLDMEVPGWCPPGCEEIHAACEAIRALARRARRTT